MPKEYHNNFRILSGNELARIKRGRIRHNELPAHLLKQLEGIYRDVARFIWPTLEEWERGFLFEMHPEREVMVWRRIADVFSLYRRRHADSRELTEQEGRALIAALLSISTGVGLTDVRDLDMVSENVGHRLVACWITLFGSTYSPINVAKAR